jgi:hypothetical protein
MSGHASILNVGDFLKNGFFSQVAHSLVRERETQKHINALKSQALLCTSVIPALRRLRQEAYEFRLHSKILSQKQANKIKNKCTLKKESNFTRKTGKG